MRSGMADDLLSSLRAAAEGLYYPSESDAPFEPFRWPAAAGWTARAAVAAHEDEGARIEEVSADASFGPLESGEDADRYRQLRRTLERAVRDLTVIRAGEVRVAIYLIGRTRRGDGWVGLRTTSIET